MLLSTYFFWFILYSFAGWLYESIVCSLVKYHHLINRGFLWGPYCPIYGAGAVINILLLQRVDNIFLIFFITMVTSGVVEYLTSYVMEKLFDARWWDYTRYPLNINGRICLYGCLVFGFGNVILLKLVQPIVAAVTALIPFYVLHISMILVFIFVILDIVYTTIHMTDLNEKLKNLQESISALSLKEIANAGKTAIADFSVTDYIDLSMVKQRFKREELRILRAFPSFHSTKYEKLVDRVKEMLKDIRKDS